MTKVKLAPAAEFTANCEHFNPSIFITNLAHKIQTWLKSIESAQHIEIEPHHAQMHVDSNTAYIFKDILDDTPIGSVFLEPLPTKIRTGFNLMELEKSSAVYMTRFMLDPEYIGNKIGDVMLQEIQNVCSKKGVAIVLDTWEGNAKLRKFYERNGFSFRGIFGKVEGGEEFFVACYSQTGGK
ncbi:hypothetical protein HK100_004933 [Physocladia obscura]|uniref:N-acetyltransferase domain-containing protein n=1 Tax=Physocladia obscura TaxID=109957 RepID=A0AAD5STT7_9FUNG|nr:hypothetical protein HK100_004933 [Physocladia obscura]